MTSSDEPVDERYPQVFSWYSEVTFSALGEHHPDYPHFRVHSRRWRNSLWTLETTFHYWNFEHDRWDFREDRETMETSVWRDEHLREYSEVFRRAPIAVRAVRVNRYSAADVLHAYDKQEESE